jgi:16S rRNA (cytosine967-C5)-methyltransferase
VVVSAAPRRRHRPERPEPAPADDRPGLATRRTAARLLAAVIDKATPLDALTDDEHGHPDYLALDQRDRSLARAILASALRFRGTISALIAARLDRPLPANAATLSHVLHVGAAQILFLDIPDSAAVDLAVSHAQADPRTKRFSGLVNAVLREIARRKERALPAALREARDVPDWFATLLDRAYGAERAAAILAIHRVEAPVDLTVKADPEKWAAAFGGKIMPTGSVRLARLPAAVPEMEGFAEGEWFVQDAAAALPARLLGDIAGRRVLDLCAAPGGKTAQLALGGAHVTALEKSASRARRLASNLERLVLGAEIVVGDLFSHRPDEPFDAVLLDAPCSSTGTVRRHPDIPWSKSDADIVKLADLQRRMLEHAAGFVRPGGLILFSNCSLDPREGEEMVAAVLEGSALLSPDPILGTEVDGIAPFLDDSGRLRTTPEQWPDEAPALSGLDGFFAARFRRL